MFVYKSAPKSVTNAPWLTRLRCSIAGHSLVRLDAHEAFGREEPVSISSSPVATRLSEVVLSCLRCNAKWTCHDMFAGRLPKHRKWSQHAYDDGRRQSTRNGGGVSGNSGGVNRQWTLKP